MARARANRTRTTIVLVVCAIATSALGFYAYEFAVVGSAYVAHMMCSGVFVSGRTPASIVASDLAADDLAPLRYVSAHVDADAHLVTASVFGLARRTAIYRDDLGCTVKDDDRSPSITRGAPHVGDDTRTKATDEPDGQRQLKEVLDWAFAEPDQQHQRRTRAVVVLHDGRLVAERYGEGFSEERPLIGWSMAKSVVNALVGILVGKGALSIDAPVAIDAWPAGDPRRAITLDQLLHMIASVVGPEYLPAGWRLSLADPWEILGFAPV